MKKIILMLLAFIAIIFNSSSYAVDIDIPSYTIEQLMALSVSKQAKVDIIKKNNVEIETYKANLSNQISIAAESINSLRISEDVSNISDEKLEQLKSLLEFLQDSTRTLNEDAATVSNEIDMLLDLIITKGMKLEQYDQIIEKQNDLIVKMKNILVKVEEI